MPASPSTDLGKLRPDVQAAVIGLLRNAVAVQEKKLEYKPHAGQLAFHKCLAPIRCLFPGNRWGKTHAAARECNWWATGRHPYRQTYDPPVIIRVAGDGYETAVEGVLLPAFRGAVDERDLQGGSWAQAYHHGKHRLTYKNGSTIDFMSYKQADLGRGAQMFAGRALDLYWPDEHSPYEVWEENQARVGLRPLQTIITLTPILGKTWEHELLFEPWEQGRGPELGVECFTGQIHDNEYLSKEGVQRFLMMVKDPQMREIRESGMWLNLGGDVYSMWNPEVHFIPFDENRVRRATKTVVIDPHPSKPEAYLWCGVDGSGMFAYREYKHAGTVREGADIIRARSAEYGEDIRRFLIDPHWGWQEKETSKSKAQMYIDNGIPVQPAFNGKDHDLIAAMQEALEISPTTKKSRFAVMKTCPELKYEFEHNKFKNQTEAMEEADRWKRVKTHDDLLICAEYFIKSDPRFAGRKRVHNVQKLSDIQSWIYA